jgi:hypothetical protein
MALLKNRLFFLLHEVDDEKTVYTVFEVLNSRGLDVSWLDRLKSILMGAAFELQNADQDAVVTDLHNIWRDIYATIGLRQGMSTEALRFAATLRTTDAHSRPLGEEPSVDLLRSQAATAKSIREVGNWLLTVTKASDAVTADRRVNAVTRIVQARLLAIALNLNEEIKSSERKMLLRRWEKVSFRIYGMLRKDSRTAVGDFVRLSWRIVNEGLQANEIDSEIRAIGAGYPIDEAIENLREANCYEGWEDELRYLMFRYEEHLANQQKLNFSNEQWAKIWMVSASDSIEHIWARSKAPEKHRHRLGNLVLLPPKLNSKLKDRNPNEKVESYRQTGLLIAGAVAQTIDADGWKPNVIAAREEELLSWAASEWAD